MYALKFETASIQKYIFSSNRLKVNLGGSYIIEHLLFKELLRDVCSMDQFFGKDAQDQLKQWFSNDHKSVEGSKNFRIGYIGGGNAVLFGSDKNKLENLSKEFKKEVLKAFPGLEVYSDIHEFDGDIKELEGEKYRSVNKTLSKRVQQSRSAKPFTNRTFNHGFFNKCKISGEPAQFKVHLPGDEDPSYVSDTILSKIQYCNIKVYGRKGKSNSANEKHEEVLLSEDEVNKYSFPMEFEHFSDKNEKDYIAVVHIDGNNMGQKFIDAENLEITQELSLDVRKIGSKALRETINKGIIKAEQEGERGVIGELKLEKVENNDTGKGKRYLPIRPLITGGDDITFVCEGTLGIPLAKLFLEKFNNAGEDTSFDSVHACAGVAIVKQKYPFSKAYRLCEELIKEAKKPSRTHPGSYMSVMVAPYGTGSSLKELKEKYGRPNLFAQAYRVPSGGNSSDVHAFDNIKGLIESFKGGSEDGSSIVRNKLMDLRFALLQGDEQLESTWEMIKSRIDDNDSLEKVFGSIDWIKDKSKRKLVFEAIEWMDFYNRAYLQQNQVEKEKEKETV